MALSLYPRRRPLSMFLCFFHYPSSLLNDKFCRLSFLPNVMWIERVMIWYLKESTHTHTHIDDERRSLVGFLFMFLLLRCKLLGERRVVVVVVVVGWLCRRPCGRDGSMRCESESRESCYSILVRGYGFKWMMACSIEDVESGLTHCMCTLTIHSTQEFLFNVPALDTQNIVWSIGKSLLARVH